MNTPVNKTPLTNEQVIELLKCLSFRQVKPMPPHLMALDLPTFDGLMETIVQRLTGTTEHPLSRKEQLELASGLRKELNGTSSLPTRDFIQGYETYRFTKDFLRGVWTTHKARGDEQRIGCIVVSLDKFLPPDTMEPTVELLAGVGAVFNVLHRQHTWPLELEDAHHIFWLMHQQLTLENAMAVLCGTNLQLVLGHPRNMPDYVPGVDREALLDMTEQMKEINQEYPGWIISSDPAEIH